MMATPITEEMHLEKEWFKEAGKQTMETLPTFMNHVMNDYQHDYGTICHAIAACAIAAAWAADNSPGAYGGITGFQAGFVMWDFVKQWSYPTNKCGLKMVDYDKMLYPQCAYRFKKTISEETWEAIQTEARKRLIEDGYAHDTVKAHWQSIADGNVPFGYTVTKE